MITSKGRIRACLVILILNSQLSILTSSARSIQTINADKAKEVAREQVVWRDRLCPFSTFALDFLQSVYGKSTYKGLSPEQVVYGWLLRPEVWKDEPMIHIPDADRTRWVPTSLRECELWSVKLLPSSVLMRRWATSSS